MTTKPTAATNHAAMMKHEAICQERWKTCFNQLKKLDKDITFIRSWMIGGIGTLSISLLSFILYSL